jgi:hypothetical protein
MRDFKRHAAIALSMIISSQICAWANSTPSPVAPKPSDTLKLRQPEFDQTFITLFLKKHNINNLEEYIRWFRKNISYSADGIIDQWSNPLDTILRRSGDCEDLAFLNKAVLSAFGIESTVLGTQKGSVHHVFCVFQYKQRIYIFDNTNCIRTKAESLEEIAAFLYNKYGIDYLLEVNLYPKTVALLFNKTMLQHFARTTHPVPSS